VGVVSIGAFLTGGHDVVPLMLGLMGVILARTVFIQRETLATGRKLSFRETLPLTMTAMLITGVVIWDRNLGKSTATLLGLGVGWTAIVILDVIGMRILNTFKSARMSDDELFSHLNRTQGVEHTAEDMKDQLDRIDHTERVQTKRRKTTKSQGRNPPDGPTAG
jgi:hypothetical protein